MSNKKLFVTIAIEEKGNFAALCKKFNISRECGYKWLRRYKEFGLKGLEERSKRPHSTLSYSFNNHQNFAPSWSNQQGRVG